MIRRWPAPILLACCIAGVVVSADSSWTLVESAKIRVITDDSPAVADAVFDDLAMTRAMLVQIAGVQPQLPLNVFAVKDRKALADFAPQRLRRGDIHTFGFSHTGPHASFIALRSDRPGAMRAETLRHEFVHVLTAGLSPAAPAWLDEGLSEFWSAIVVDGDRLVVGRPVARHIGLLRKRKWLPLDAIVNQQRGSLPSNPGDVELFYAQSWAMVHYLMLGHDNVVPSFMPATSELTGQFDSVLKGYVNAGQFREAAVAWQRPAGLRANKSTLPESRALAERSYMLVSGEQRHDALDVARKALTLNPNEALALEVTGTYYFLDNQPAQARQWLTRALATGTPSYAAALYLSLLSASRDDRERYLTMAVLSKPDSTLAWQRLAEIFESDGRLGAARRWCRQWAQRSSWVWLGLVQPCGS